MKNINILIFKKDKYIFNVFLLFIALFINCIRLNAQATTYPFNTANGVSLIPLTTPINLIPANTDNGTSSITNIGFNFGFAGTIYTQFSVSSNGLLGFGGSPVTNSPLNSTNSVSTPVLMPWWDDLYTVGNGVQYQIIGVSPNRKLVIQWEVNNCCLGGAADKTFQIVLYENGPFSSSYGFFSFIYGSGSNPNTATIGIISASNTFNEVNSSTNTNNTLVSIDNNSVWPGQGRSYSFGCSSPTITLPTITTPICPSSTTSITANFEANTGTLAWYTGGGVNLNTSSNPLIASPGSYYAQARGTCGFSVSSNTITISPNLLNVVLTKGSSTTMICLGNSIITYGDVMEPGITDSPGQGSGIIAEFGYSTSNTNPNTWTNWNSASFNPSGGGTFYDEYQYTFIPPTSGTYYYAYRFRFASCTDYQYGGTSPFGGGAWDGTNNISGVVTVNTASSAPSNITGALSICSAGSSTTLSISGGSAGTGATAQWFAGSCGSTVIGTSNSITVSPSTNTTYYVRYNGICNATTCATATVTVGGTANVILAPTDQLAIVSTCDDGVWTYYESTTNPGKYVFAINWNANGGALGNSTQKAAAIVNINKSTSPIGTAPTATPITFVSGGGSPGYYSCADASTSQATFAMQRYWNVNVGGGGLVEPVNVRFFFDSLEYDAVVNAANAWSSANGGYVEGPHWFKTVTAPDGVNNTWNPGTDMDAVTVEHSGWVMDLNNQVAGYGFENGVRYVQFDGITSFSGGGLAVGVGNGTVLPLDLIYFTGTREAETNRLEWATAQERNVSHFEVQRSSDAIHFNTIGIVSAIGNSTQEEVYHFIDATPLVGNNYYRMKMIDNDGASTMSNIININRPVDQVSLVNLYPNPAKATLNFELYAPSVEEVSIQVVDVLGQEVITKTLNLQSGLNTNTLDVSSFIPGLYFLNIICAKGYVKTFNFFTCYTY